MVDSFILVIVSTHGLLSLCPVSRSAIHSFSKHSLGFKVLSNVTVLSRISPPGKNSISKGRALGIKISGATNIYGSLAITQALH